MTQCPYCGETSFYPAGPHNLSPCPLLEAEHKARLALLKAQEEEVHERRFATQRSRI